jgi:type I site-specific restriction endonuclease
MASNPNLNDKNTLFTMACVASMEYSLSTRQTTRATVNMISQAIAIRVHLGLYPSIQKQVKDKIRKWNPGIEVGIEPGNQNCK